MFSVFHGNWFCLFWLWRISRISENLMSFTFIVKNISKFSSTNFMQIYFWHTIKVKMRWGSWGNDKRKSESNIGIEFITENVHSDPTLYSYSHANPWKLNALDNTKAVESILQIFQFYLQSFIAPMNFRKGKRINFFNQNHHWIALFFLLLFNSRLFSANIWTKVNSKISNFHAWKDFEIFLGNFPQWWRWKNIENILFAFK